MLRYFGQEQLAQCAAELTAPKPYIPPSFFADHNIDPYVISFFRTHEAQVTIARDEGLATATDDQIFDIACRRKQVIVTYDHDFLDFARFNVSCGPGLIILPARGTQREPRLARQKLDAALSDLSKFLFNPATAWAGKLIHFDKKGTAHLYAAPQPVSPTKRRRPRALATKIYGAEVAKASVLLTDTTFSADLTEPYGFLC